MSRGVKDISGSWYNKPAEVTKRYNRKMTTLKKNNPKKWESEQKKLKNLDTKYRKYDFKTKEYKLVTPKTEKGKSEVRKFVEKFEKKYNKKKTQKEVTKKPIIKKLKRLQPIFKPAGKKSDYVPMQPLIPEFTEIENENLDDYVPGGESGLQDFIDFIADEFGYDYNDDPEKAKKIFEDMGKKNYDATMSYAKSKKLKQEEIRDELNAAQERYKYSDVSEIDTTGFKKNPYGGNM